MELRHFATDRYPLHCSQLPAFMLCPWSHVMKFLQVHQRDVGSAAHTGSATHKAVSKWHQNGKEVKKALAAMKDAQAEYPLADFLEAERLFLAYTNDPRNQEAQVVHAEYLFHGEISKGITLEGTCDQIREEDQTWKVWDLKTSRLAGPAIRDQHLYQVCAYAVLASKRFRREVHPGGIVMVRGYDLKGDKVWYPYDHSLADARFLMDAVAARVRDIRAGRIHAIPGDHCGYCIGTHTCLDKLQHL